jgi:hypothetical protein
MQETLREPEGNISCSKGPFSEDLADMLKAAPCSVVLVCACLHKMTLLQHLLQPAPDTVCFGF